MTRSFLTRSAIAAVLLGFGLAFVWGDNSLFDKVISKFNVVAVAIVLATLVSLWVLLALWVVLALKPTKWAQREASHGKAAAVIAVISAACLAGQPAQAVSMVVAGPGVMITTNANYCVCAKKSEPIQSVAINQPFTLSLDEQRQVDDAVAKCSKDAKDSPGFVVSAELAIGIFIAAVVVGTVLVIIVRLVCKSLDRMREDLSSRLSRLKNFLSDPSSTNQPAILGAALFNHRAATTNDLSVGAELVVGFTASSEPITLTAALASGEPVKLDDFLSDFGLKDRLPLDSSVGTGIYHAANGAYVVSPDGSPNLVALTIKSCTNLIQNAWSAVVKLHVPEGAIVDWSDLTGNSDGRYWRAGVAQ